jgi:uncharacterized damage-inducible protein DinB
MMTLSESFLAELQQEAATTRRLLEGIPEDKLAWKPHGKSMTIGRLAGHLAELPKLVTPALQMDELDLASGNYTPLDAGKVSELLAAFDENIASASALLKAQSDERLQDSWTMRMGDHRIYEGTRMGAIRTLCLNHILHHRGQLSVYLRLLDVPLPSVYGPTADTPPPM